MAGRKVFVGSLPDNVSESVLREEFEKYGRVEDMFVKQGCDPGRQWAMVTFSEASEAQRAKEATDRVLQLPGASKPAEVMIARNQGNSGPSPSPYGQSSGPRKIFVGSLPDSITESQLRDEFSRYGQITDTYLKTGCDRHKQWAFVTFTNSQDAETAKTSADRVLKFPDSEFPCEVTLARNQGMRGEDPLRSSAPQPVAGGMSQGPTKIFVGSLPDDISETALRAEFSRYGQILDVFLKTGCEPNKQWAFVCFAHNGQAQQAKDATDRRLTFPGAPGPCEVMFAKHQGKNGTDPLPAGGGHSMVPAMPGGMPGMMPPTHAWRVYQTPQGMAYYHNHATGVTQWECPPEFHYPQPMAMPPHPGMYGAMYPMSPAPAPMYHPY